MSKFIFVTGGVVSSLGKGLASSAIGTLLEHRGLTVNFLKLDPYLNVDPGTLSPYEHGETFVTEDGAETDLDLGHYERFTSCSMGQQNNATTGKIYQSVIERERQGGYLGHTVQVVPHITDEIKQTILQAGAQADITIVEIGGTVGDIESLPFLEAIRQLPYDLGREHILYIHLTLVPYVEAAGELKTKPTQHSVTKLREIGIQPHLLLCRSDRPLPPDIRQKIAMFCNLDPKAVISARDVTSIYEVPQVFHEEEVDAFIDRHFTLDSMPPDLSTWAKHVDRLLNPTQTVRLALVGKYTKLKDSYKSLLEALVHGGLSHHTGIQPHWIEADRFLDTDPADLLHDCDGLVIPGGFGTRGIEGKLRAIRYAREQQLPFLGICLGMQLAVVEFARHVAGLHAAHSTEMDPDTKHPVIHLLPGQHGHCGTGGTMRLGAFPCHLRRGTRAADAYTHPVIHERHRHRYEFNLAYQDLLARHGLICTGLSPDQQLVEIVELPYHHPWFVGVQFHPEYQSRLRRPHPLISAFIGAALTTQHQRHDSTRHTPCSISPLSAHVH